ncbi:hypothetical protein SeGA_2878, partial [Salmonella enterica subsp. enterica serovar Gaminara str. A4-567]
TSYASRTAHVQCLKSQNFPLEYPFRHG